MIYVSMVMNQGYYSLDVKGVKWILFKRVKNVSTTLPQ